VIEVLMKRVAPRMPASREAGIRRQGEKWPCRRSLPRCWLLMLALLAPAAHGQTFSLPPQDVDLVGQVRIIPAVHEDTLLDIARRYQLGHDEIILANPDVDRWLPGEGTPVTLPTRYILPAAERVGLVLNVPEMRLYYYPPVKAGEPRVVRTYPVSVGRMDWETPLGSWRIISKQKDPVWRPPASIRAEAAERGETLPEVVPAGPDNPLGRHALRLSIPSYLIHGTDKPWGVGMRVTHGCLRMYPEDIAALYDEIPVDTPVRIVKQPVKIGWLLDTLYIEVHPPLEEDVEGREHLMETAMDVIRAAVAERPVRLSGRLINAAVHEARGYPVAISLPD
jgi:L,D-transpeptidase ErfK/SrfK